MERLLNEGYGEAEAIVRRQAKTFYFASRFLPQEKQKASFVVYAICRPGDVSLDTKTSPLSLAKIEAIQERIDDAYQKNIKEDCLLLAFSDTVNQYDIPKAYFDDFIKGLHMDREKNRYANFDELYTYCYRIAGVLSLMMFKIIGYSHIRAEEHAIELGVAMQLTRMLRDIKEDYLDNRIYLPEDEMKNFGVNPDHFSKNLIDKHFVDLLKFQIARARKYYEASRANIKDVTDAGSCIAINLMKNMSSEILGVIEKNGYDVFRQRADVPVISKIVVGLKTIIGKQQS